MQKSNMTYFTEVLILFLTLSLFSCGGGSGTGGGSSGSGTPPPNGGGTPQLPSCKDGYCLIPEAKDFQMGSIDPEANTDENLPDGANRKLPPKVTLSGFLMGKTEVTVGQYMSQFVAGTPPPWRNDPNCNMDCQKFCDDQYNRGSDHPMICLTFDEKRAYCKKQGGDLPTAARIERAAKGVSGTDKYGTPIQKAIIFCANGDPECSQKYTATEKVCGAGEKDKEERANSFGVCDLAGNVWESALDKYESDFYSRMPSKDPYNELTDQATQFEEFRGGSFGGNRGRARARPIAAATSLLSASALLGSAACVRCPSDFRH